MLIEARLTSYCHQFRILNEVTRSNLAKSSKNEPFLHAFGITIASCSLALYQSEINCIVLLSIFRYETYSLHLF